MLSAVERFGLGEYRRYPNGPRASMSIGLPLSVLFVGVFVCLNTFGE